MEIIQSQIFNSPRLVVRLLLLFTSIQYVWMDTVLLSIVKRDFCIFNYAKDYNFFYLKLNNIHFLRFINFAPQSLKWIADRMEKGEKNIAKQIQAKNNICEGKI